MTDVAREKYSNLMTEIEDLEDKIEDLRKDSANQEQIKHLNEDLTEKRNELARLSDGCGRPQPQS